MVVLLLISWGSTILFSTVVVSVYIPTNKCTRIPLYKNFFASIFYSCPFDSRYPKSCEVLSHCSFDLHCISVMVSATSHIWLIKFKLWLELSKIKNSAPHLHEPRCKRSVATCTECLPCRTAPSVIMFIVAECSNGQFKPFKIGDSSPCSQKQCNCFWNCVVYVLITQWVIRQYWMNCFTSHSLERSESGAVERKRRGGLEGQWESWCRQLGWPACRVQNFPRVHEESWVALSRERRVFLCYN